MMEKRDYKVIRDDFEKALSRKDIRSLIKYQKELIESGVRSKGDWFRLAFFCGRESLGSDLMAFMKANELRLRNDFSDGMFGFRYSDDFNDINTFYQIGTRYPFLTDADYEFIESYYTKSGTYNMIDEMLFDKELLQRELKHYEAKKIDNTNLSYSESLLDAVYKAALYNLRTYDLDELLETRHFQKRVAYEPVYVYNMETNAVEKTTSRILDEWTKKIIGQDFSTNHLLQKHCRTIFGSDAQITAVLNEEGMINPHFDVDMHFDAAILQMLLRKLSMKLGISVSDERIHRLENCLSEEWLKKINSEQLY